MEINLRKAAVLQNTIRSRIATLIQFIRDNKEVTLETFEDAATRLAEASAAVNAAIIEAHQLYAVLNYVRDAVSATNSRSGVDAVLCELAHLSNRLNLYKIVAEIKPRPSLDFIKQKQAQMAEKASDYAYGNTYRVSVMDKEYLSEAEQEMAQIVRSQQLANEQLLTLNVSSKITMPTWAIDALKASNIII